LENLPPFIFTPLLNPFFSLKNEFLLIFSALNKKVFEAFYFQTTLKSFPFIPIFPTENISKITNAIAFIRFAISSKFPLIL
jgi:hypothetical protein